MRNNCLCQRVFTLTFSQVREVQEVVAFYFLLISRQLVFKLLGNVDEVFDSWRACRESACLVKNNSRDAVDPLQHVTTLDQHSE